MTKTMSWHSITLTRQEYESGEMAVLFGAFRAAYVAKNGPEGMAILGSWTDDGTCYLVYVSPKSVRHILPLLDAYSAKQIATPDCSRWSWLYGDEAGFSASEVEFEA
jgi:hypothetical protein